jgi:beta-glucosidase
MNDTTPTGAGPAEASLPALTTAEKVALLAGADTWRLPPVERLGIGRLVMSDGPSGVRGESFVAGRSACFPAEVALAATWDPALAADVGRALGEEAQRLGVHVLLGPTINLHRHPLAGRSFECFSEDPLLTSELACAYVSGVQSAGVACCAKHLAANESEFERHTISSDVTEAVLRELYLTPFEDAVRAGVWSIMASYNRLNGTHASEHPWLLTDVLRDEWGFDGVVVSDWFGTHSTAEAIAAGLDVEMPGPSRYRGKALLDALASGLADAVDVDRSARRVLRLIDRTMTGDAPEAPARPAVQHRELIRTAGARGMVLLQNRGVLPLSSTGLRTVAVIGQLASNAQIQGGGSAHVNPPNVSQVLPALTEALGPDVSVTFERGYSLADWPAPLGAPVLRTPDGDDGVLVEYRLAASPAAPVLAVEHARRLQLVWLGRMSPAAENEALLVRALGVIHPSESGPHRLTVAASGSVRLVVDGQVVAEHQYSPVPGDGLAAELGRRGRAVLVELSAGDPARLLVEFRPAPGTRLARLQIGISPPDEPDLLERAVAAASSADAVVAVVGSPDGYETEGRDRPSFGLPGSQDEMIAAVAAANRRTIVVVNTGAPCAMPWADQAGAIVQMWFPGQEAGAALADVLTGAVNPSGKLPTTFPRDVSQLPSSRHYPGANGHVEYGERFSIGYRHAPGEADREPLFPFGHGLSYAAFNLGPPQVQPLPNDSEPGWQVTVPVTNTAGSVGREVVQLYAVSAAPDRPVLELKAFASVEVRPGETANAVLTVPRRRLRQWRGDAWAYPAGPVRVRIGTSSASLPLEAELPPPAGQPSPARPA